MSLPHNLRLRPDLIFQLQDSAGGTWVVKDPVSLRFFLFGGDERFIMDRLDGRRTLEQIVDDFTRERAPKRMTLQRLQAFLAALHRNGLVSSDAAGQGHLILERELDLSWRESVLSWSNLLAIRLPGVNPTSWLDRAHRYLSWCFSWWFLACAFLLSLVAVGIMIAYWGEFQRAWPRLHEFVGGRNLIWLGAALILTKCLHELAHGLTCRHFGGRCHEMGVILLVFMPCLYCNVTDAWMLRSRWQRIAISAAGMLAELFLAAVAVLVWRYTQPGPLNSISLNVVLVCGLSTLLFNGNPLLKHDGYYILSDLVRMPNLWQESRNYLYGRLDAWFRPGTDRTGLPPEHPWLLITYAGCSIIYRICLMAGILLFLYRALHPKGLDLIVVAIAASIVWQNAIVWSTPLVRWSRDPTKWNRLNMRAPLTLGIVVGGMLTTAFLVPFPSSVTAPVVVQPRDAAKVFVTSPGVLTQAATIGDRVEKGQPLAVLENAELTNERLAAASELTQSQERVRTLQLRLSDDTDVAAQLAVAQEILADLSKQAHMRDTEYSRLVITAPSAGTILAAPITPAQSDDKQLPTWVGSPLASENRRCYLERGTLLCLVGAPDSNEAVALIDETDLPFVKVGQSARLQFAHAPADILAGELIEIAEVNAESAPPELVSQYEVAVRDSKSTSPKPVRTLYQARVRVDDSQLTLLAGSRGEVRIKIAPQTIAEKLSRWVRRTFSVDPKS